MKTRSDASSIDDDLDDDLDIGIQAGKKKWFPDVENALNVEYAALKRALHKDYVSHVSKLEQSLENIEARIADAKERRAIERRESAKERRNTRSSRGPRARWRWSWSGYGAGRIR